MKNIRVVSLIALTSALSACANKSAESIYSENQGSLRLSSERLQTIFDGNTLEWADGTVVYYNGSEIRASESDGTVIVGTIRFTDNLHCRSWNGGNEKCSTVYEDGKGKLFFFVDGKPDSSGGYGRIVAGNPNQL